VRQRTPDNVRGEHGLDAHLGIISLNIAVGGDHHNAAFPLESSLRLRYLRNHISGERQAREETRRCESQP